MIKYQGGSTELNIRYACGYTQIACESVVKGLATTFASAAYLA